ncbi:plasmid recombination enzyme [Alkalispirillum mobile]|uniref:Plasmid recombination enzyme n=1 Tax=Alkalispirillum mobile TaxID=85925 RepID=A0A498BXC9_9GAMM|nr:plasmid recombination protein [Alkalispirillum mobile]RLK48384.1 plasmid recombination enzyme [Alkalispirillum mobile]
MAATQQRPQFVHVESYKRERGDTHAASSIIGEALRIPGHCPHVEDAKPPEVHPVDPPVESPHEFRDWLYSTMAKCREANGAYLRRSAVALLTVIASMPREIATPEKVSQLRDLTVGWIYDFFGEKARVPYAITHDDESHPHVHVWVIPAKEETDNERWPLGSIFRGRKRDLYELQDSFYELVGHPLGMTRKGEQPQGIRLTRRQAIALRRNPKLAQETELYQAGFKAGVIQALYAQSIAPERHPTDVAKDFVPERMADHLGRAITRRERPKGRDFGR